MAKSQRGFPERLKQAMSGRSLGEIERITGVKYQNLQRYLDGAEPRAGILATLATRLGVSLDWLVVGRKPDETAGRESGTPNAVDSPPLWRLPQSGVAGKGLMTTDLWQLPESGVSEEAQAYAPNVATGEARASAERLAGLLRDHELWPAGESERTERSPPPPRKKIPKKPKIPLDNSVSRAYN